jgi:hypothetical protein
VIVGLVVGLVCATAAGSLAAMNKMHWQKRNWHFQVGYLAGFLDMTRIVQSRNPETSLAREYRVPPGTPPHLWLEKVNALYAEEVHAKRPLTQIIVLAGEQLAAETGYNDPAAQAGGLEAYRKYMELFQQREAEARAKAKAAQHNADEAGAKPGADGGASE